MKIPKLLNSKIHKKAHAAGIAYAEQMALRLKDEVKRRMDAGETFDTINAYLGDTDAKHTDS